ncbi:Release factor glutamine methyltransferase [Bifidobacterium lemurum]|uniref:Release factor glutamine methyltransferase n=1 Tax=Bifidobacterium lemurum TaxID=1603886 RepID=A0A261FU39_9BIFI|nr:peptide chain release factor N(5)-glutamine methyltransferase [Bifidobacterium lemurum]OZG62699.1 Release factor glutamine methyltransferase [Bifidobacterium lemurum]QOL34584.1 peptide chain release factor N(5)-glutamine methyltransferase [Bifidobacterium lemurum]
MIDPTNTSRPVADTIRGAARTLDEAGIETAEHDAKLLLAEAYGREPRDVDKARLMGERWNDAAADRRFASFVARRAAREPLQHITGHAPFRYLDLKVGPGVFIPRPETETVVQAGLDWITQQGLYSPRVVDLCAGSGAIGLSVVTEVPGSQVWAVELSDRTAEWTRRNLADTAKQYPSIASNYQLEVADATDATTLAHLDGTIDLVITNPPYVPLSAVPEQPEVRDHDPHLALYGGSADGTLIPERIIERSWRLLREGGALVMEHDVSQGDQLAGYARSVGFGESHTERDWTGRDRYLFAIR